MRPMKASETPRSVTMYSISSTGGEVVSACGDWSWNAAMVIG